MFCWLLANSMSKLIKIIKKIKTNSELDNKLRTIYDFVQFLLFVCCVQCQRVMYLVDTMRGEFHSQNVTFISFGQSCDLTVSKISH